MASVPFVLTTDVLHVNNGYFDSLRLYLRCINCNAGTYIIPIHCFQADSQREIEWYGWYMRRKMENRTEAAYHHQHHQPPPLLLIMADYSLFLFFLINPIFWWMEMRANWKLAQSVTLYSVNAIMRTIIIDWTRFSFGFRKSNKRAHRIQSSYYCYDLVRWGCFFLLLFFIHTAFWFCRLRAYWTRFVVLVEAPKTFLCDYMFSINFKMRQIKKFWQPFETDSNNWLVNLFLCLWTPWLDLEKILILIEMKLDIRCIKFRHSKGNANQHQLIENSQNWKVTLTFFIRH